MNDFDFNPEKALNKTLMFDTSKTDVEILRVMMTDALNNKTNEFYIDHPVGSNYFTLKRVYGR